MIGLGHIHTRTHNSFIVSIKRFQTWAKLGKPCTRREGWIFMRFCPVVLLNARSLMTFRSYSYNVVKKFIYSHQQYPAIDSECIFRALLPWYYSSWFITVILWFFFASKNWWNQTKLDLWRPKLKSLRRRIAQFNIFLKSIQKLREKA